MIRSLSRQWYPYCAYQAVFGNEKNRKLVPTRWSIVAVDDMLGKKLISDIHNYENKIHFNLYYGSYLGNHYIIMFFPAPFSYELFETYAGSGKHTTDHEGFNGRKDYAADTVGGYYTVRLAILEKLKEMKRQGAALVLRFITSDYSMPLGVWVTREAARKALKNKPIEFGSKELMLKYADTFVKKKFNDNAGRMVSQSKLLREILLQKQLGEF